MGISEQRQLQDCQQLQKYIGPFCHHDRIQSMEQTGRQLSDYQTILSKVQAQLSR